ncbi:unnamed protein product [Boreogadus saida]
MDPLRIRYLTVGGAILCERRVRVQGSDTGPPRVRPGSAELEAQEQAEEREREAVRRQIIEEERQKLLRHHATKLLGYFPKGLFREDDLQHFDDEFRSNFQKQQADMFSGDDWDADE